MREVRHRLEHGQASAADVIAEVAKAALDAPTRTLRLDACALLGDLAGRALGADWDTAETAAFALLEAARLADTITDRRGAITAMGRGFRNLWLLPFVHKRLSDREPAIATAALLAAGGLGFPALEDAVASKITDEVPEVRRAAIAALGRMGAMTAVDRLVPLIPVEPDDAIAALTALTEIRSPAGRDAALRLLDHDVEPGVQVAAVRYLAELGALEVQVTLRRLARAADPEVRLGAMLASRALTDERNRDAAARFLAALSEPDRAVRAVLARRLRTLPVDDVIAQAEVLLSEDADGVVEVVGELREPEVTRYLLSIAERDLPANVRARAIGSIEANQAWEREALAAFAHRTDVDDALRAAAIQTIGAFATTGELLDRIGDLATAAPALRGAVLWAVQLAGRMPNDAGPLARVVEVMLDDSDPAVRRRAAYVAGNLGLASLATALARRCDPEEPADLRVAAYVALGELRAATQAIGMVRREQDPRVLGAASNALVESVSSRELVLPRTGMTIPPTSRDAQLTSLAPRVTELLRAPDARAREAACEIAGLLDGIVGPDAISPLATDASPSVRGAVAWALGRIGEGEAALLALDADDDPAVRERAAAALLRIASVPALSRAIAFCAGDGEPAVRAELAAAIAVPRVHAAELAPAIDDALARIHHDDPAYEPLLRLKLAALLPQATPDVDAEILGLFPAFVQLTKLAGFDALVRSVRTAESLYQTGQGDADLSAPITLWMKALENYVHAWLGPKLAGLQREPAALFDYIDHALPSWPGYQRWLEPRWKDPAEVGGARVELPLRHVPNAARELQERRRKRLDSTLSVTEWARIMLLFAVDHPSGFKNLMKLKSGDRTVTLAHRLHALAAVRNLVTHRSNAGAATLSAFRRAYYATFDDLLALV